MFKSRLPDKVMAVMHAASRSKRYVRHVATGLFVSTQGGLTANMLDAREFRGLNEVFAFCNSVAPGEHELVLMVEGMSRETILLH